VAALVTALHTPLEPTGRFVSVAFFLLCLVPTDVVLGRLRLSREGRLLTLCLLLVSPFYLFWSRTFMIESVALFFGLCYLAFAMPVGEGRGAWWLIPAALTGGLAAVVKITTFVPFVGAVLLFWLAALARGARPNGRRWVVLAATVLIPLALGVAWTRYADGVRDLNPLARLQMPTDLRTWIFGTLAQRLAAESWAVLWERFGLILGHLLIGLVGLTALGLARRRWTEAGACLLVALSAPLVFTNLHVVHEYYAYANGVFVLAALGMALAALVERGGTYRRCAYSLLAAVIAVAVLRYQQWYYPKQAANHLHLAAVSEVVRELTEPDDVIVVLGCDWSPELPFACRRRALMVPNWPRASVSNLPRYLQELGGYRLGALVYCDRPECPFDQATLHRLIGELGFRLHASCWTDHLYQVYRRNSSTAATVQPRLQPAGPSGS
jgi:hypothetical protein